jgi:hypothetical protein
VRYWKWERFANKENKGLAFAALQMLDLTQDQKETPTEFTALDIGKSQTSFKKKVPLSTGRIFKVIGYPSNFSFILIARLDERMVVSLHFYDAECFHTR